MDDVHTEGVPMTMCVHAMFACVCPAEIGQRGEGLHQEKETAGRRRVYEDADTPSDFITTLLPHYTTTTLGTHYTHNNRMCVQSVGTIRGGRCA